VTSAAILISGRGSNMRSLVEANLPVSIRRVVSNRPDAGGLGWVASRGIPTTVIDHRNHPDRSSFDAALALELERADVDLVLLAGFMRVLTASFVDRFRGRLINIHPSLLPAFPGLHTHRQALEAGVRVHGCTVHFVTPALDSGPIIAQAAVPVLPGDTEDALAARVLAQEHVIYPLAVRLVADGRVALGPDGRVSTRVGASPDARLLVPWE
jgi:phosphoribosylglycinamide formyltransferase 1